MKSSITLPPEEYQLVLSLKRTLSLRSNVDVVRRGLALLRREIEAEARQRSYLEASLAVRGPQAEEVAELDALAAEGL